MMKIIVREDAYSSQGLRLPLHTLKLHVVALCQPNIASNSEDLGQHMQLSSSQPSLWPRIRE
jgi:hypothetical protein